MSQELTLEQAITEASRAYQSPLPTGQNYGARQQQRADNFHRVIVKLRGEGFTILHVCGDVRDWKEKLAAAAGRFIARNCRFVSTSTEIVGDDLILSIEYREVGA
jgi:hypothetical protein